ncbi:MAG: hypothetical protein AAF725_15210, partial [Acidobacteriota bacterium]
GKMWFQDSRTGLPWGKPLYHLALPKKNPEAPQDSLHTAVDSTAKHLVSWSDDGVIRLWDLDADYDFPAAHLPLMVEAMTGTTLDEFGRAMAIPTDEWRIKRRHYLRIAAEHAKVGKYPHANLSMRQCRSKVTHEGPRSGTESQSSTGYSVPYHSVY